METFERKWHERQEPAVRDRLMVLHEWSGEEERDEDE